MRHFNPGEIVWLPTPSAINETVREIMARDARTMRSTRDRQALRERGKVAKQAKRRRK